MLAGASAGVIGVDADGKISILNRSAEKLIGQSEADAAGRKLTEVMPELAPLFTEARTGMHRLVQGQITINRDMRERNLSVRVTTEQSADEHHGYVVTLDDITDLVTAQRTSAWADIARRIAHEIKNPLTPIQLSAERLKRKYGKVITEDKAVFEQCTDTIVRQVDDIKRMVDEFSRFARMPKPVITVEDVADTARQVVFLQRVGHPDIDIEFETEHEQMPAKFDRRLISQALTNIVKNATEAIAAVPPEELGRGRIRVSVKREGRDIVIDVIDNGTGLPKENRNRLLEPYVTTREKGTGLGLAIVGRILEEHGGRMELFDAPEVADRRPRRMGAAAFRRRKRRRFQSELSRSQKSSKRQASDRSWRPTSSSSTTKPISANWSRVSCRTRATRRAPRATATPRSTPSASRRPNLVFLDIWLQGSKLDGLQLLDNVKEQHPELPVVMISGHGNIETAVSAIKRGAYDFIEKPFKADRLVLVANRALENSRLKREVKELKQLAPLPTSLVGKSPADQSAPPRDREGRADQQPHPDRRPVRRRQGADRAHHPRAIRAAPTDRSW